MLLITSERCNCLPSSAGTPRACSNRKGIEGVRSTQCFSLKVFISMNIREFRKPLVKINVYTLLSIK